MKVKINGDILCSLELSKIINVPDQKAQIEHYNELSLVQHQGNVRYQKKYLWMMVVFPLLNIGH